MGDFYEHLEGYDNENTARYSSIGHDIRNLGQDLGQDIKNIPHNVYNLVNEYNPLPTISGYVHGKGLGDLYASSPADVILRNVMQSPFISETHYAPRGPPGYPSERPHVMTKTHVNYIGLWLVILLLIILVAVKYFWKK